MTTLIRPNGRVYRPRDTTLRSAPWTNAGEGKGDLEGVLIIGTHDLARAQHFADVDCVAWYGVPATEPRLDWVSQKYGGRYAGWTTDEVRGRPAIWFVARA